MKDSKGHGSTKKGFGAERKKQMKALAWTATDPGIDPRTGRTRVVKGFNKKYGFGKKK